MVFSMFCRRKSWSSSVYPFSSSSCAPPLLPTWAWALRSKGVLTAWLYCSLPCNTPPPQHASIASASRPGPTRPGSALLSSAVLCLFLQHRPYSKCAIFITVLLWTVTFYQLFSLFSSVFINFPCIYPSNVNLFMFSQAENIYVESI